MKTLSSFLLFDDFLNHVYKNFPEEESESIDSRIHLLRNKHKSYLENLFCFYQDPELAAEAFIDDEVRLQLKYLLDNYSYEDLLDKFSNKKKDVEVFLWGKYFVVSVIGWNPDLSSSEDEIRNSLYDYVEYSEVTPGILFEIVD